MSVEYGIINQDKDRELIGKGVRFLPVIGSGYGNGLAYDDQGNLLLNAGSECAGKRLLVLGESHYIEDYEEGDDISEFTRWVVGAYRNAEYYSERWMNTFTKFARALAGRETSVSENCAIWDSFIFYNYLQVPMSGPRMRGDGEDYENAVEPFFAVLEMYHPDLVVVWGCRLWAYLPDSYGFSWEPDIVIGQNVHRWGKYVLPDGREVKVLPVYHPSAGFGWDYWNAVIKKGFGCE
ncbi:MAG: hypothetical protein IJ680_02380 [Paludibacteraceae bacterium]|nr:hypothetical protein [Paludibacteraceae bacterium]